MSNEMIRMQQNAEQRRAVIMEENIDSLMRFQEWADDLTDEDITKARLYIGACLIENFTINMQIEV